MKKSLRPKLAVTGIGVACGAGFGKKAFTEALFKAPNLFTFLSRKGRKVNEGEQPFIGIELPDIPQTHITPRVERILSLPSRVAVLTMQEAWREADLDRYMPQRIGLVVGGSGLMAREQELATLAYNQRQSFIPPRMGHMFLDTQIAAVLASIFPIRGLCDTINAASASGSAAVIQAKRHIEEGRLDACIALGSFQDLSLMNLYAMRAMGAMGSERFKKSPNLSCRPMDKLSDGFIYGESCSALVIERYDGSQNPYGFITGGAMSPDGNLGPNPDTKGQQKAAFMALKEAGLSSKDIDYINGHATGSSLGDKTELASYKALNLEHAWINTSKSIIGHGLSSAGAIELAATFIQMREKKLHPCRNLEVPIEANFNFTPPSSIAHSIKHALKFSFGFGGINLALALTAP